MDTFMKLKLLFSDENAALIEKLQQAFEGNPDLIALTLRPDELPKLKELDALYMSIIAAERWGSKLVFYESQILKTRPEDQGWPPYIVTGIALKPDDPRAGDPIEELKLVMKAVLYALKSYNQQNKSKIRTVGFWTENLRMPRMDVSAAGEIIRSAYQEHYPQRTA
jgi:hypothetical protein